jgi:hypothetical protein
MATTAVSTATTNVTTALGAGSGIDIKSLAQSLVDAEKAPRKTAIDKGISKNENVVSGLAAVKYALTTLQAAAADEDVTWVQHPLRCLVADDSKSSRKSGFSLGPISHTCLARLVSGKGEQQ